MDAVGFGAAARAVGAAHRGWLVLVAAGLLVMAGAVARAQDKEPVRIGAIYPLTGSASFLGIPQERALRMRLDELNKAGGVSGHKLELVVYDTEGNGTKAAQQLRRLVSSDKVHVIFGPSSSGEALQTIELSNELKVPQIAHGGTEAIVVPPTRYVFNSLATDRVAISHVLSHFRKKGLTTVAMLSAADGYGQSGRKIVHSLAPQYGVKIVAAEEFNRQDPDMTAQVLRARQSGASAMLIWSALPAPTIIARNAKAVGYDKPIFVGYGAATSELAEKAGPAGEGLHVSSFRLLAPESLRADDPVRRVVLDIHRNYLARYGEAPTNFAQHSYDAALILEQAIRRVQGAVTRESLRDAIEQVDVVGANGHFRFSPGDHGGLGPDSDPLVMLRYTKGKWQIAD